MRAPLEWINQHKYSFKILAFVIALLCYFSKQFNFPLTKEWGDSVAFMIIVFVLIDVSNTLDKKNNNTAYPEQLLAYKKLEEHILEHGAKNAVLIQYSATSCMDVIRALLRKGASVTLYIQHEDTPRQLGSLEQVSRITDKCKNIRGELGSLYDPDRILVRKFHTPSSLSGIRIDDQVLCIGWYTYEAVDDTNKSHKHPKDIIQVSGHDVAALIVWRRTDEYEALNRTFSILEANYKKNADKAIQF